MRHYCNSGQNPHCKKCAFSVQCHHFFMYINLSNNNYFPPIWKNCTRVLFDNRHIHVTHFNRIILDLQRLLILNVFVIPIRHAVDCCDVVIPARHTGDCGCICYTNTSCGWLLWRRHTRTGRVWLWMYLLYQHGILLIVMGFVIPARLCGWCICYTNTVCGWMSR